MANPSVNSAAVLSAELNQIRVDFNQNMLQDATFYDVANWAIPGYTIVEVSSKLGGDAAILTLSPEMLTGAALSVTVSNVTNETFEPLLINSALFTGQGVAPTIASVAAASSTTVMLTFSEAMQNDGRSSAANYFVVGAFGASISIGSIDIVSPTESLVHLNAELLQDGKYSLVILVAPFKDLAGNPVASGGDFMGTDFLGIGVAPQMSSAVLEDNGKLTITFDEDMRDEGALVSRYNYLVEPTAPGAAPVFVKSAKRINARTVSLEISETTAGASYVVAADAVRDLAGNVIDPLHADATFSGAGATPVVSMVLAIGPNRVDVVFSEEMFDNDDIRDPTRYAFTGGLTVLSATPDPGDARIVSLVTSTWTPNVEYTLTITP